MSALYGTIIMLGPARSSAKLGMIVPMLTHLTESTCEVLKMVAADESARLLLFQRPLTDIKEVGLNSLILSFPTNFNEKEASVKKSVACMHPDKRRIIVAGSDKLILQESHFYNFILFLHTSWNWSWTEFAMHTARLLSSKGMLSLFFESVQ